MLATIVHFCTPPFALFEVYATRQQNNETDRAFHHKNRLQDILFTEHRVDGVSE